MQEEESEDFDDETMMKLDDKIAATFRHMTKNKKGAKEEEVQLLHFKMRWSCSWVVNYEIPLGGREW